MTDLSEESVFEAGRYAFAGLVSPRSDEEALLLPTRGSGTTRRSRSGRSAGPLQVNPSAWSLARKRPATGSPDRGRGRMRSLGAAPARRLLSG